MCTFRLLVVATEAMVAVMATNTHHYGPPSLGCLSDEQDVGWNFYGKWCGRSCSADCKTDADCPKVPDGDHGTAACTEGSCGLYDCNSDADCGEGIDDPRWVCVKDGGYRSQCGELLESKECTQSHCNIILAASGRWTQIQSSSSKQEVEFDEGVTRSYSVTDAQTWGAQVTSKVSSGFQAFGLKASAKVSAEISATLARQYTSTFAMSSTEKHTFQFDAGVVWQWQFTTQDGCGDTVTSGHDLALTQGAYDPPCCLPGFFENITKPSGSCHTGPNLCDTDTDAMVVV